MAVTANLFGLPARCGQDMASASRNQNLVAENPLSKQLKKVVAGSDRRVAGCEQRNYKPHI
jgi:hypothetical protein